MKISNIPLYRFIGYTDAWELRKIFEIADRFNNLRVPIASSLRIPGSTPYYGANGIQDYVEGYTHNGEFVLIAEDGANDLKNYPVNLVNGKIWVNNHAHVLQGKENITNNKFLAYSINRANIEALLVGSGRAKLNSDVLMNIELEIPSLKEQSAIGTFFSTLDQQITLHQRKLDMLKEQKKTYLNLLFPAKGQTQPALRFQGFEDDWEEVKLGEVVNIQKGTQRGKQEISEIQSEQFPYPVYNGGQNVSGYTDEYNRENMVIVSEGGASAGYVNYYSGKFWSGGHNFSVDNLDNNLLFIKSILEFNQQKLYELKVGSGLPNVQLGSINQFALSLPTLPEQEAIGTFFQTLDQEIAQVEDKLASLKEMKKTLLRKLFVS